MTNAPAGPSAHPDWAIDLDPESVRSNYRAIAARVGAGVRIMPSIKADAYGFGAVAMAKIFESLGAFALFTGTIREAIAVRGAGVRLPVIMFGTYLPADLPLLIAHGLVPTVYNRDLARAASAAATGPTPVYVKVDAGLGRLGVPLAETLEFVRMVGGLPNLTVEGIYTHLPFARPEQASWAQQRLAAFDSLLQALDAAGLAVPVSQARASCCIAAGLIDRANAVCVGHLYYGLSPFADGGFAGLTGLDPVVRRIRSRLIHVARHEQGADVAIGGLYGLRRGKTIGVLPIGLATGLGQLDPAHPACAVIGGQPAPLLSVSLEHTTIDLDRIAAPRLGDEVLLVDETLAGGPSLRDFAKAQGRTPLAMMVSLSAREHGGGLGT